MDYIVEYIDPVLIPIVITLWCIGKGIKESKAVKDAHIPGLLAVAGVALAALWMLAHGQVTGLQLVANAIVQGILCAAVAVWGNQIVKQAGKAKED